MKWLFFKEETDSKAKVVLIYNIEPPEELINKGNYIMIESVPKAEQIAGKSALPYCNPQTGEFWYEYVDRPLTEKEKITELENAVLELSILLGGSE